MSREEIFQGVVALNCDNPQLQSTNFLEGLSYIHEFNRNIVALIAALESRLKRTIRVLGGFIASSLSQGNAAAMLPPYVVGFGNPYMRCVFIQLRSNEAAMIDNAQHIHDDVYCITI